MEKIIPNSLLLSSSGSVCMFVPLFFIWAWESFMKPSNEKPFLLLYIDKFSVEWEPKLNDILLVRYKLINKYHERCYNENKHFPDIKSWKATRTIYLHWLERKQVHCERKEKKWTKTLIFFHLYTHSWNEI